MANRKEKRSIIPSKIADWRDLMKKFRPDLFSQEAAVFLATQIIGVWAGSNLLKMAGTVYSSHSDISLWEFVIIFILATAVMFGAFRVYKGDLLFKLMFGLMIFLGAEVILEPLLSPNYFLIFFLAFGLSMLRFAVPRVWSQNLSIIIGLSGVSASLGLQLSPWSMVIILLVLSAYDFVAVYKTRHMVAMFKELVERGVFLSIVIPEDRKNWLLDMKDVRPKLGFLILGTGDVALPLIFAVSALAYGLGSSIGVMIGAFLGLVSMHAIFALQKEKAPMPALPPIAVGSIIGFLLSLL